MRQDLRNCVRVVGFAALALVTPLQVSAEMYADLYTGAVFTNNTDLTVTSTLGTTETINNLKVNDSWTAGGRAGYWLDSLDWLGFGLDLFFFHAKAPSQSATSTITSSSSTLTSTTSVDWSLPVLGVGFDVLRLRAPLLRSEQFPHGRLQPFLSAGPAIFVTWAGQVRVQPQGQQDTNVALGAKAGGGLTFLLTEKVGLFTEYRFTHFTSKLSYQNNTSGPATETYKTSFDSHHIIAGLSFSFP
jgi:opacity protein-like surface antigen